MYKPFLGFVTSVAISWPVKMTMTGKIKLFKTNLGKKLRKRKKYYIEITEDFFLQESH